MANDLVAFSGVDPKKVYFPFANSRVGFEGELQRKRRGASLNILGAIRSVMPFKGGNDLLRAVHDLDIGDKHIDLISVGASSATPALPMRGLASETPGELIFETNFAALKTSPVDLSQYHFTPDPNIEIIGKVSNSSSHLAIADGLPMAGTDPVVALDQMANLIDGVREALETFCLGSKRP